jgi:hypothetical protein
VSIVEEMPAAMKIIMDRFHADLAARKQRWAALVDPVNQAQLIERLIANMDNCWDAAFSYAKDDVRTACVRPKLTRART